MPFLSLILVVAAFNMIGALTMLVMEKQKDIQVLKAMGADDQRVQQDISSAKVCCIALLGAALGIIAGPFAVLGTAYNFTWFRCKAAHL